MNQIEQNPIPGSHVLAYRGDSITFTGSAPDNRRGSMWLRTNIGNARTRRREIIDQVEKGRPALAHDWHDLPMVNAGDSRYSLDMPLLEVGRFEAKVFYLYEDSDLPVWPEGDNVVIKVEPSAYCCANTIYTAFVRQFGPNRHAAMPSAEEEHARDLLEEKDYAVIPRSGKFRDLIPELDFIIGELGFRIVQLLPIHPTPTTYARMGPFGSPFAALDFQDVDPSLAEFDRRTTPMDQFLELVDAVHARSAKLFLDIPVNHTGWASHLQVMRPHWFHRNKDRTFQSPGAWGVTWHDLAKLNYGDTGLWQHMAEVFLFWCRRGVDGFRCDAGYMVPYAVWEYVVAKVREEFPDTVFLLEGLGGSPETVERLLTKANLNWAYSELFQNYDRQQIEAYLPGCIEMSATKGALVHFAETHDNDRLASRSKTYARMRTALAALASHNGSFGITNGVEWFAESKIDVHGDQPLNWGNSENQVAAISRLNAILKNHPAFHPGASIQMVQTGNTNCLALLRKPQGNGSGILIVVNLDDQNPAVATWKTDSRKSGEETMHDLLSGEPVTAVTEQDNTSRRLAPGEVLCLTRNASDIDLVNDSNRQITGIPPRCLSQSLRATALELAEGQEGKATVSNADVERMKEALASEPWALLTETREGPAAERPFVRWSWPRDLKRTVMIPPDHLICVEAPFHFIAKIRRGETVIQRRESLVSRSGKHFAVFVPLATPACCRRVTMFISVYEPQACRHSESELLCLPEPDNALVHMSFNADEAASLDRYFVCTNDRGAMAQVRGCWGEIGSRYDAILAGNLNEDYPVDRTVMFSRCRAWIVNRGYSQELNRHCLERAALGQDGNPVWEFAVPVGMGKLVSLVITLTLAPERNAVRMKIRRRTPRPASDDLDTDTSVKLILRPGLEDRVCHATTKAYTGPETSWPHAVTPRPSGFSFAPSADHRLEVAVSSGVFVSEPQWTYMVPHPFEADRGLEDSSDVFSPGYFSVQLTGGSTEYLQADILTGQETQVAQYHDPVMNDQDAAPDHVLPLKDAMRAAMKQFIVKRGSSKTVIAGYPWFLDWGRDTLICLRGIIAAGFLEEASEILQTFASLEDNGTLPNMIRGGDHSNRDTSDAPLWFLVACSDLAHAGPGTDFLEVDCGGRNVTQVMQSIVESYIKGTPNGIAMDPESSLVFSPSHFTWMDTNHPAGSPREGYPIEIQALWYAALTILAELGHDSRWSDLASQVRSSIATRFADNRLGYLSDCLHAGPGTAAAKAAPDDALRPNQLLTITLEAVADHPMRRGIIEACDELLVPGAIRSLADRTVSNPLPIRYGDRLLNDPQRPYWGSYRGDENTGRKPAYHNGTAWTWLFPSYCEAVFMAGGKPSRNAARALLSSAVETINRGSVCQVPEILDGDSPHTLRGCGAQAWGVTELYRVLAKVTGRL